ncbi:MAG TPA: AAA family ATPase [Gemmatimonadaceae bacterium]
MTHIRLRIVGESVIEVGSKRITPASPHVFGMLLYLGTEHDREVPRAELIELLYPGGADSAHRLRQLLYKLRGMGAPVILTDRAVKVEAERVQSDADELSKGSCEARRARISHSFEVLPHYAPPADTPLSGWVEALREKLHNALRQQLTRDMEVARRKADWRYLEAIARRTMELDPLNESAVLALAEATARTGSKARAISILDAYRAELGEERASLALPASLLQKRINATRERDTSSRREPFPFIGRERELEFLLSQWESTRRGNAHVLWLTGNKSVGKSRLAEELGTSVQLRGSGHLVTFSMSPMDADRPLSLVSTLANRLSSLPGAAGCDPISLAALGKLSGSISIPSAVNPENINSAYSNIAIRNAVCDLTSCVCDEHPVLVLVDEAQYVDEASEQLLDAVLGRVANKRLLIVLCGATERAADHRRHSVLHLEPLSTEASARLWEAMVTGRDFLLPYATSQKCLDTAAGNPGHMELLARQAARDPDQFLIPADLIALIDRRLSLLSKPARYALEATVVLDDAATTHSVADLTGLAPYELLTALHALESSDLLVSDQSGLRCRSGLIAERVRATALGAVMSAMEGRAAEHLEREQSGAR